MINKILIVLLPVAAILIGILYYYNQKAEAPTIENIGSYNQYKSDLMLSEGDTIFLTKRTYQQLQDSLLFYKTRIMVFKEEKKIGAEDSITLSKEYLQAYAKAFDEKTEKFLTEKKNKWPSMINDSIKVALQHFNKDEAIYKKYNAILQDYARVKGLSNRVYYIDNKTAADNLIDEITELQNKYYIQSTTSISNQLDNSKRLAKQLKKAIDLLNEVAHYYENSLYLKASNKLDELKQLTISSYNIHLKDAINFADREVTKAISNQQRYNTGKR